MCLRNRQLQSSSYIDDFKMLNSDDCEDRIDARQENSAANKTLKQDINCSYIIAENAILRRKLEMFQRLNKFMELDSTASKYGSKIRQNILIISDFASGSSYLGEILNQNPQVFYLYEPLKSLEYYCENRPESVYD